MSLYDFFFIRTILYRLLKEYGNLFFLHNYDNITLLQNLFGETNTHTLKKRTDKG